MKLYDEILLKQPRIIRFGLCEGSSDIIGVKSVVITPDMLGKTVGIFTAFEVKTDKGTPSKEQLQFIQVVRDLGGIAGIIRTPEDIERLYHEYFRSSGRSMELADNKTNLDSSE